MPALLGLSAVFLVILALRSTDNLLHASFWGEDGWLWYSDAYRVGIDSLFWPNVGYLSTLQRLVAIVSQQVPLVYEPVVFAVVALVTEAATAVFIVSDRMASAWPSAWGRLLFAFIYLVLPNSWEIYGNLTDAHWHLAVLAFCILVSAPPVNRRQIVFDAVVLTISGVSGPFSILLLPVALWQAVVDRRPSTRWRSALLAATAIVQIWFLLTNNQHRTTAPLGAGPIVLSRIIALQIFLRSLSGTITLPPIVQAVMERHGSVSILVCLVGIGYGLTAAYLGPPVLRKAILFAGASFAAALVTPLVSRTDPQWQSMTMPLSGDRYYVYPILAWLGALFVLAADRRLVLRVFGIGMIATMLAWGVPADWHYPLAGPIGFKARARAFMAAPPGTRMEFPIRPGGPPMVLIKHAP
ncbi:MAG TPA: hypothetical protein VGG99_23280 [Acetobacteraceae bacterium]|jgi:hypothetical protein